MPPGVSWPTSFPFALGVPGERLPSDTVCRFPYGVANTFPSLVGNFFLHRPLSSSLPEFFISDGFWPTYPKNSSEAGVNKYLYSPDIGGGYSPGFPSIHHNGFDNGVEYS